jgi:hypothetical protein
MSRTIHSLARAAGVLLALAGGFVSPASAAEGATFDASTRWVAPVGRVESEAEVLLLRGEPSIEQSVVVWPGLAIDASTVGYARVEHEGLAPGHQLSLYFRNAAGEHVVDFPRTKRRATIALTEAGGWSGTVTDLGLVYGPVGNVPTLIADDTLRVQALAFEPASAWQRVRAFATRAFRIEPRIGSQINVLPDRAPVWIGGGVLLAALAVAAFGGSRRRRLAVVVAALAFVSVEAVLWRQWLTLRDADDAIADARRAAGAPIEIDWPIVQAAAAISARYAAHGDRVAFHLAFEDPYVADRLKWHLLPLRAWRDADPASLGAPCVVALGDRPSTRPDWQAETAFGPIALSIPAEAPEECAWTSSPSSR